MAVFLDGRPDHAVYAGLVADVHLHGQPLAAVLSDVRDEGLRPLAVEIGHDDAVAVLRQRPADGRPDAAGAAGYHHDL